MRLGLALVLAGCVTRARVSRDSLRYPHSVADRPLVLRGLDDDGREVPVRPRPDTRLTLHLARGRVDARAREILLAEDSLVIVRDDRERRIPWDRIRYADVSEARPWLGFAIALGAGALAGGALVLGGVAP